MQIPGMYWSSKGLPRMRHDDSIAGTFTETDNGFTFTPYKDFNGDVRIDYIVTDNKGAGIQANINLTIDAVDDSPEMGELPDWTGHCMG